MKAFLDSHISGVCWHGALTTNLISRRPFVP